MEAAKAEWRHYEELARQRNRDERQPQKCIGGGTRGVWLSQVGDLSQLPMLTVERGGPGRHRVMPWGACIARCAISQLLVSAGLEWVSSQVL